MTANNLLPEVFCLFHESTDCRCRPPVVTRSDLSYRLRRRIELNELLIAELGNAPASVAYVAENERLRTRLAGLSRAG